MVPIKAAAAARRGWGEAEGFMGLAPLFIFLAGERSNACALMALVEGDFSSRGYD
jgi:hypothetical protein